MPTSFLFLVMGTPEILNLRITSSASEILSSGDMVTGSTIMPLSERFTLSTSLACCSMVRLRCITPSPPCCAMAMASRDSVTVSMAALITGMLSAMLRESWVRVSACAGITSERPGSSNTSSKVSASGTGKWIMRIYLAGKGLPLPILPQ